MELFNYKKPIAFMKISKKVGILSLVLVIGSWVLLFTKGLNYGIDFAGGTLVQLKYDSPAPIKQIREKLSTVSQYDGATVTEFGSPQEVVVRIKKSSSSVVNDIGVEMSNLLKDTGNLEVRSVDIVSAKTGNDFRNRGLEATLYAILGILIYVSFRFEWRFAVASVLALVHDVSISLGMLVIVGIDVNLDILAAILTIVGYSLNDTIIVFDRIREGIRTIKDAVLSNIIDESITRTLSRTVLTSLTTFFVVFALYLFGGESIRGFSFTLLVGIIVGTYSSIFVASPLLSKLGFNISQYRQNEAEKLKREKEREKMRSMYEQGTI